MHNIAHRINSYKKWEDTVEDEIEDETIRINNPLDEVHVHLPNGDVFPFGSAWFVIAAGAESGH